MCHMGMVCFFLHWYFAYGIFQGLLWLIFSCWQFMLHLQWVCNWRITLFSSYSCTFLIIIFKITMETEIGVTKLILCVWDCVLSVVVQFDWLAADGVTLYGYLCKAPASPLASRTLTVHIGRCPILNAFNFGKIYKGKWQQMLVASCWTCIHIFLDHYPSPSYMAPA